jgi:hypothetical protein
MSRSNVDYKKPTINPDWAPIKTTPDDVQNAAVSIAADHFIDDRNEPNQLGPGASHPKPHPKSGILDLAGQSRSYAGGGNTAEDDQ